MISEVFAHCPRCASTDLSFPTPNQLECRACGFVFFFNAATSTAVILENASGQVLLVQRANDPGKGLWDLPGGFVEPGETAEEAALRELHEELGNVNVGQLVYSGSYANDYTYKDVTYKTVDIAYIAYIAYIDGTDIALDDELLDYEWVRPADIDFDRIAFTSIQNVLRDYCDRLTHAT